jgi:ribosome biogenesis GTPase / thiamine phosphate phosphatase
MQRGDECSRFQIGFFALESMIAAVCPRAKRNPCDMDKALGALGWSAFFVEDYQGFIGQLGADARAELQPARVIGVDRTSFRVQTATQPEDAILSGTLLHGAEERRMMPVIGDWVVAQRLQEPMMRIVHVLERRSKFSRAVNAGTVQRPKAASEQVMAANVDTVLIVSGLDEDFDLSRLARYVSAVQISGARPVVILNKADLVADPSTNLEQVEALATDLPVHLLSATEGQGLEQLGQYFQDGLTVALIGSSGVGKSTLTNQILQREAAMTGDTRVSSHHGTHTTTARTMYFVPGGGLLIDNPGLREIAIWDASEADFADIEALAVDCKFRKCTHTSEFGCAVQKAIRNRKLDPERLLAFQKARGVQPVRGKRR